MPAPEDREFGELVAVRAAAVSGSARRERATALPGAGDVQGPVAAAMVRPVRSRAGGSAGRPAVVPPVLGLGLDEARPDETTICRFRQAVIAAGLRDRLLGELNGQLEGRGLMLKQGTMIDATLVAAQAAPPRPVDGAAGASPHDRDANWTRQNGKSYSRYKAHVAMDQGSRLIRRSLLTPGRSTRARSPMTLSWATRRRSTPIGPTEKQRRRKLKSLGVT